jgi:hypothetical protein
MILKLTGLLALIVAFAALLIFTPPGHEVLRAFGMRNPDCTEAAFLDTLGFHVPQCVCCAPPPIPPLRPRD